MIKRNHAIIIICLMAAFAAFGQIKNPIQDAGAAIDMGSSVKVNSSGQIAVCGDNDSLFAGVVTAVQTIAATDYYLISSSDIFPAKLDAAVTAGDLLTTSAGGSFKTVSTGEIIVGVALQDGHATDLRKAIFAVDRTPNLDTLAAYLDTTNSFFQRLRANANPWLADSVTFVEGTNITLTQTGDSITITASSSVGDNDWSGAESGQMYAYDSDDSVAVGRPTAAAKFDVEGGIMMRGDRYWGVDATAGADSFWIYDDGDTTRFDADNAIKIGDGSLIVGTNGNVHVSDTMFLGEVVEDSITDSLLCVSSNGKVSWMDISDAGNAVIQSYGEMYIEDTIGVEVDLPAHRGRTVMDSASAGLVRGSPYVTAYTSGGDDSLTVMTDGGGIHQMNLSLTFSGPSGVELSMALCINDTIIDRFILGSDIASAGETKSSNLSGLMELAYGDVITVKLWNRNDRPSATTIKIYNFSVHLTRIFEN